MTPILEFDRVTRTYPGTPPIVALDDATLRIDAGTHVAIVGTSGSGKSTLMNLLGLLDRPDQGTYRLAGRDTTRLGEKSRTALRAHTIGFVFQAFHLLRDRTVADNVAVGLLYQRILGRERNDAIAAALDTVGLVHRRNALASTLSGGEAQRVAIARAIAGDPAIVLADEPTGNLDRANSEQVLTALETLRSRGLTVVMVTHDDDVAAHAQRTITVDDGRVTG